MNGTTMTIADGGAVSARRAMRLIKLATRFAGRCVDPRKISTRRKKRDR